MEYTMKIEPLGQFKAWGKGLETLNEPKEKARFNFISSQNEELTTLSHLGASKFGNVHKFKNSPIVGKCWYKTPPYYWKIWEWKP